MSTDVLTQILDGYTITVGLRASTGNHAESCNPTEEWMRTRRHANLWSPVVGFGWKKIQYSYALINKLRIGQNSKFQQELLMWAKIDALFKMIAVSWNQQNLLIQLKHGLNCERRAEKSMTKIPALCHPETLHNAHANSDKFILWFTVRYIPDRVDPLL